MWSCCWERDPLSVCSLLSAVILYEAADGAAGLDNSPLAACLLSVLRSSTDLEYRCGALRPSQLSLLL